jgi:hypothetical protein
MANVLTEASVIGCGHGPGKVSVSGNGKLVVNDKPVLLKSGIHGKSVSACATQQTDKTSPCKTASVTAGEATKLTVNNSPVMLDATLAGTTNGNPVGTLTAAANQNKLTVDR